jgi:prevent-host-death family protein
MKSTNVSELKAKLSAFLAEVRRGGTVIVYDRSTPIARLVPFQEEPDDLALIEPSGTPVDVKRLKPVRLKKRIDLDQILREMRGDR